MPYTRPLFEQPKEPHPLEKDFGSHGELSLSSDPGWISERLGSLHEDGTFALHQLKGAVERAQEMDLSEYKEEIAKAKRTEPILKARQAVLTFLTKHIADAKSEIEKVRNTILRVTEPEAFSDPVKSVRQELRDQEIRNIIRTVDPKDRKAFVANDKRYIQAAVGSPDNLLSDETLTELRRQYAFQQDPSMELWERDTKEIYAALRKRAGEVNATAVKMLIDARLDDPITIVEHYNTFPPETPYEREMATKRILQFQVEQDRLAKQAEWEKRNQPFNPGEAQKALQTRRGAKGKAIG